MRYLPVTAALVPLIFFGGCASHESPWKDMPTPRVLASIPPLASIAMNVIGKDEGTVISLLTTSGIHTHGDPNAREINLAREADVIFSNGLGLDDKYLEKLKAPAGNPKWRLYPLGGTLDVKSLLEGEAGHEPGDGDAKAHPYDPHVWLSPINAKIFAQHIGKSLASVDVRASKSSRYLGSADTYGQKLDALLAHGKEVLKDKKDRKFVSFHDSLRYFCRDFELEIAGVVEIEAGVEPGGKQMGELIEACLKNNVRVIAVEPQFSSKNAATTIRDALKQKGIDAIFVEIDPMETAETVTPELYIDTMTKNLDNLAAALK